MILRSFNILIVNLKSKNKVECIFDEKATKFLNVTRQSACNHA